MSLAVAWWTLLILAAGVLLGSLIGMAIAIVQQPDTPRDQEIP